MIKNIKTRKSQEKHTLIYSNIEISKNKILDPCIKNCNLCKLQKKTNYAQMDYEQRSSRSNENHQTNERK